MSATKEICERCDLPRIPAKVWSDAWHSAPDDVTMKEWRDGVIAEWPNHCDSRSNDTCNGKAVDWRARALSSEAKLAEVDWCKIYENAGGLRDRIASLEAQISSANTARLERDYFRRVVGLARRVASRSMHRRTVGSELLANDIEILGKLADEVERTKEQP